MAEPTNNEITPAQLIGLIKQDPTLTYKDKEKIIDKLNNDPSFFRRLIYGALGAGAANLLARFLLLSKRTKIVVTIAGFGLGQLILNQMKKDDKPKTMKFNSKTRLYELNF